MTSTNTLILDNIQGTFNTGVGTITFDNGSNVVQLGAGVTITSFDVDSTNDGLHESEPIVLTRCTLLTIELKLVVLNLMFQ